MSVYHLHVTCIMYVQCRILFVVIIRQKHNKIVKMLLLIHTLRADIIIKFLCQIINVWVSCKGYTIILLNLNQQIYVYTCICLGRINNSSSLYWTQNYSISATNNVIKDWHSFVIVHEIRHNQTRIYYHCIN